MVPRLFPNRLPDVPNRDSLGAADTAGAGCDVPLEATFENNEVADEEVGMANSGAADDVGFPNNGAAVVVLGVPNIELVVVATVDPNKFDLVASETAGGASAVNEPFVLFPLVEGRLPKAFETAGVPNREFVVGRAVVVAGGAEVAAGVVPNNDEVVPNRGFAATGAVVVEEPSVSVAEAGIDEARLDWPNVNGDEVELELPSIDDNGFDDCSDTITAGVELTTGSLTGLDSPKNG